MKTNELQENFNNTLDKFETNLSIISNISNNVESVISKTKELDRDMHELDLQFNAYIANLDASLKKYEISTPVVSSQLDRLNSRMDQMLNAVLTMNASTPEQIHFRSELLDKLNSLTDQLATMMIKLL